MVYYHAFESNPVEVNKRAISAANAVTGDSSTDTVHRTNGVSSNNSPTNGAADEANRLEIPTDSVMQTTIVDAKNMSELSEEAWKALEEFVRTHAGDTEAVLEFELASNGKVLSAVKTAARVELMGEIRQAIEERNNEGDHLFVLEGLKQKIQSGEVDVFFQPVSQTLSISIDSQPNPTHSVLTPSDPSVESVTTHPEIPEVPTQFSSDDDWAAFEELLSEFSDDDWAELERLLRTTSERETPQRDEQAPLNVQPQRQIEEAIEEPPVAPSVRQEIRQQRGIPLESDINVPPPKTDRSRTR